MFDSLVKLMAKNIRVNRANKTVEFFDEYGQKKVYRDLTDQELDTFEGELQEAKKSE